MLGDMLSIPGDCQIIEMPTSRMWFDESGIVYAISKKSAPQTLEQAKQSFEEFRSHIGPEKICLLIDVTHATESSREVRAYAAEEFPRIIKAIAMISESALGKMLANLFFNLKSQPYPVKMFNNEGEAKAWLKQYL